VVGVGIAIILVGVVLLFVAVYPRAFGLSTSSVFPFGGGFLGVFLVLWGILLLVRVALWTSRRRSYGSLGPGGRPFDPAIMAARQRYARGEITREQFEQIVSDLRRPPGPLP
jgi:uncharacterized membrane protein